MLKLSYPKLAASAVFLGLCVMPAKADILLGTAFFPIEFISSTAVLNQAQFTATDGFGTDASVTILSDSPFYGSGDAPASITLLVGSGGTTAANAFAYLLTNGVNDVIELRVRLGNTSNATAVEPSRM
ncbi:MAG: hypothetical protein JWL90_4053 [Chthoniobacteraceae bacterium]|nr:hypothetical protein [Chthoniobacteraceae bacterium]